MMAAASRPARRDRATSDPELGECELTAGGEIAPRGRFPTALPAALATGVSSAARLTRAKRSSPCGSASGITRSCWASSALLTLPNLGGPSLWDVDEGVNAQAAREMREAGTWIVPTFNYQLRTAKPVMLYWLQRASYAAFGVNEFSARLPSVLAGWLAVLLTYELARRMFARATALWPAWCSSRRCSSRSSRTPRRRTRRCSSSPASRSSRSGSGTTNGSRAWWVPDRGGVRAGGADQGADRRRAAGARHPHLLRLEPRTGPPARSPHRGRGARVPARGRAVVRAGLQRNARRVGQGVHRPREPPALLEPDGPALGAVLLLPRSRCR